MLVLVWIAAAASSLAAARAPDAARSVRSFYRWYLPRAVMDDTRPSWAAAFAARPSALSYRLRHALAADIDRQARARDIVGIDFDPFLNSQDPCGRAIVGSARPDGRAGRRVVVSVRIACGPGAVTRLEVVAVRQGARILIDDIRYADGCTLRRMLPPRRSL